MANSTEINLPETEKALTEILCNRAKAIYKDIVANTPVDTSLAKNNWQIGTSLTGKTLSIENDPLADLSKITPASVKGNHIFIENNIPYIEFLENGSSKQAPRGMIRQAILKHTQK